MKKGGIYEGVVDRVSFPNKGHVNVECSDVIVKNTIPGQKIRFIINKKKSGRFEGRLLEVIEKSAVESKQPECGLFPGCGGCTYQTMGYDAQIKMKYGQVEKLLYSVLKNSGKMSDEDIKKVFCGIYGSPAVNRYRNKMEFSFGDEYKGGPLSLGLHKRGSTYDILTADRCMLVHEDINKILRCVLDYCAEENFDYYHKNTHEGFLRHLLVRRSVSTGEILAAIVTSTQRDHDFSRLVQKILDLELSGNVSGLLHMKNDSVADVVRSDETVLLYGKDYFYEELLGLKFKITPFSFFQTNTRGAEVLYKIARDMIGDIEGAIVFDLYSGTGTIAQVISPSARKVIGIEIVEEAVEAAKENAAFNGLDNCEFYAGDVLKVLDEIEEKPDFLILDPPREGINPKALQKIIKYQASRIVYISCKPTSLAADLEAFLEGGYKVERIKCVDMFPHTVHVETVVLMSRKDT